LVEKKREKSTYLSLGEKQMISNFQEDIFRPQFLQTVLFGSKTASHFFKSSRKVGWITTQLAPVQSRSRTEVEETARTDVCAVIDEGLLGKLTFLLRKLVL
jgi:hypothetical protein